MKTILKAVCALMLVMGLVACQNKGSEDNQKDYSLTLYVISIVSDNQQELTRDQFDQKISQFQVRDENKLIQSLDTVGVIKVEKKIESVAGLNKTVPFQIDSNIGDEKVKFKDRLQLLFSASEEFNNLSYNISYHYVMDNTVLKKPNTVMGDNFNLIMKRERAYVIYRYPVLKNTKNQLVYRLVIAQSEPL